MFKNALKQYEQIENTIARKKEKMPQHLKKWDKLLFALYN